jgi:hypothetical protein
VQSYGSLKSDRRSEHNANSMPGIEAMVASEKGKSIDDLTNEDRKDAYEIYLATAFLLGSDRGRYGKLIEDLQNDYLQGRGAYPKTITAAFNLLTNWQQDPQNAIQLTGIANDGVAFMNIDNSDSEGEIYLTNNAIHTTTNQRKYFRHYPYDCDGERISNSTTTHSIASSFLPAPPQAITCGKMDPLCSPQEQFKRKMRRKGQQDSSSWQHTTWGQCCRHHWSTSMERRY